VKTAKAAGAAGAFVGVRGAAADASRPLANGFSGSAPPVAANWNNALGDLTKVNSTGMPRSWLERKSKSVIGIYCRLLMKLIVRFWNGNIIRPIRNLSAS